MEPIETPDYEAIARRLIVELEELRQQYANARFSLGEEVGYWLRLAIDFVREPGNQTLVWIAFLAVLYLARPVFLYLRRRTFP